MARPKGKSNKGSHWKLPFRQSEIERAVRAAKAQGFSIGRIDIEPRTGKISIVAAPEGATGEDMAK